MSLPVLSICALVLAVALSMVSRVNVGLVALLLAYLVGAGAGGLRPAQIAAGFPAHMFITVVALALLFEQARRNGTLDRLAAFTLRLCRGNAGLVAPLFFALAAIIGSLGAGNIGAVALLAPLGMAVAGEVGVPPFLMALLIAMGGNAAALSPLAPTGVVAAGLLERIHLPQAAWPIYLRCLAAHAVVGLTGYLLLGGVALFRKGRIPPISRFAPGLSFTWQHHLTLLVLAAMIAAVAALRVDVGAAALAASLVLFLGRADRGGEGDPIPALPWGALLMVCGMMTLVSVLERAGGVDLLTAWLGRLATRETLPGWLGLLTGLVSAYSSSSGVVLPAFLPMVPGLAAKLGVDPLAIASAIGVGAHLVDVSPLSTLGALCLANAPEGADRGRLYRQLLVWGLSMSLVGAVYCQVAFGWLGP